MRPCSSVNCAERSSSIVPPEEKAHTHPMDWELRERLRRREVWMEAASRWGFDTLGFGIYLLRTPGGSD